MQHIIVQLCFGYNKFILNLFFIILEMICIKCGRKVVSEEEAQLYATSELGKDHECYIIGFDEVHLLDQFLGSSDQFHEIQTRIDACNIKKVQQKDGSTPMILVRLSGQINWYITNIDDRTFEEIAKLLGGNFRKCLPGKKLQCRHQEGERSNTTARKQFLDKILDEDCK